MNPIEREAFEKLERRRVKSVHLHNYKFIKKVAEQLGEGWWATCLMESSGFGQFSRYIHEYIFEHNGCQFALESDSQEKLDDELFDRILYLGFISRIVPEDSYKKMVVRKKKS